MNESVDSDALVMPSRMLRKVAGCLPAFSAFSFSSSSSARSTYSPCRYGVSPGLSTSMRRSICRTITSMCLSLIFTPCRR